MSNNQPVDAPRTGEKFPCPSCGKSVTVTREGGLRKHNASKGTRCDFSTFGAYVVLTADTHKAHAFQVEQQLVPASYTPTAVTTAQQWASVKAQLQAPAPAPLFINGLHLYPTQERDNMNDNKAACPVCDKHVTLTKDDRLVRHNDPRVNVECKSAVTTLAQFNAARNSPVRHTCEVCGVAVPLIKGQYPFAHVDPSTGAYCEAHGKAVEASAPVITLKRLSAAQLDVFSRVPLCQVTDRWVLFNETDAPALINALETLTDVDQRTQMKCGRRVLQSTGGAVEIKRRQQAPRDVPNAIKVRTSDAQRGVLTFIDKYLASGLIAGVTSEHTYVNPSKVRDALTPLRDMHTMKLNTRACHSLIKALEPHSTAPHVDTFNAAPLITPPAADPFTGAALITPADEQAPAPAPAVDDSFKLNFYNEQRAAQGGHDYCRDDDDDDDDWYEDDDFTAQYNATSERVHDPLHDVRPAPAASPDDVVSLPLTRAHWGDAYARVEHILTDYGYAPAADQVSVKRTHIKGLLAQLHVISVHGHAGRFINYDFEGALDDELEHWGAQSL